MKNSFKIALIAFSVIIYSCNSTSKKHLNDSVVKPAMKVVNTISGKIPNPEEPIINTKLIFPKYSVKLHDFIVYTNFDNKEYDFEGDTSKVSFFIDKDKIWNLTAKTDTLPLPGQWKVYTNIIEIIPEDKLDNFKIYYNNKVYLYDFGDSKEVDLEEMTNYKVLKDSLSYFFKIPKVAYDNSDVNEIKKTLKLKDTTIRYIDNGDNKYHVSKGLVSYKNKPCIILSAECVYLKIERYHINKLMDIRYLMFSPTVSEAAD